MSSKSKCSLQNNWHLAASINFSDLWLRCIYFQLMQQSEGPRGAFPAFTPPPPTTVPCSPFLRKRLKWMQTHQYMNAFCFLSSSFRITRKTLWWHLEMRYCLYTEDVIYRQNSFSSLVCLHLYFGWMWNFDDLKFQVFTMARNASYWCFFWKLQGKT